MGGGPDLHDIIARHRPALGPWEAVYRDLHRHPELSGREERTAALVVRHLRAISGDFEVHAHLGGHGVVGVLRNGPGHTILLRADMDGLPIEEKTGLDYASRARVVDEVDDKEKPVMHACGHDTHVTSLLAAASLLYAARGEWTGTLIALFQPSEERGNGAQAMVDAGLYEKVPIPDFVLGQHVNPLRTGTLSTHAGPTLTAADSFIVTVYGRGGHGAMPQQCIDPVVLTSYIIVRLQSVVSRMVGPNEFAVVTCGSVHGGDAENIIPDKVELKLNVRTYDPAVRTRVLDAIKTIVESECEASGVERKPTFHTISSFPVTVNDPKLTEIITGAFHDYFGPENVVDEGRGLASEDFAVLATVIDKPCLIWNFGGTDAEKWDKAKRDGTISEVIPGNHSPFFAPVIEPTLKTAIDAISLATLTLFSK